MTKIILLDFWGTLVENGVWSPTKQVRNILGIRMPFPEYVVRMEKSMMTKEFPSLKEVFESLCEEFSVECNQEKLDRLIGLWNKAWMLAKPYDEVKEVLKRLKKEYKLVLVSNSDSLSVNSVLEKFSMEELFDEKFLSCQVGHIKSHAEFFNHVLEKIGANVEECVMVGDSIQSDMFGAKNVGMKTILIDRKNSRDYHPKIKNLNELEKVLSI